MQAIFYKLNLHARENRSANYLSHGVRSPISQTAGLMGIGRPDPIALAFSENIKRKKAAEATSVTEPKGQISNFISLPENKSQLPIGPLTTDNSFSGSPCSSVKYEVWPQ